MKEEKYKRLIEFAVPSKEVRDYCAKIGRIFAPYELATLICQNTLLSYSQKDALLAELVPELRAEPDSKTKTISGVYKNHYSNSDLVIVSLETENIIIRAYSSDTKDNELNYYDNK
jgi:hypothetical protein